jgi:imidazolonepropionase-like amidohydrolase
VNTRRSTLALLLLLASSAALIKSGTAGAQPAPKPPARALAASTPITALAGATVYTGAGGTIEDGVIVIQNGVITAAGKGVATPVGAVQVKGAVITPGLTDALTSVGLVEVSQEEQTRDDEQGGPDRIRAAFRAADGYNPASSVIDITRAAGVTSVGVIPTGGLISGQSAWVDLDGSTALEAIAAAPLALHVDVEAGGGDHGTGGHGTALLRIREAFDDARVFARTRGAWERNQSRAFAPSRLDLEALATVLSGKLPVVFRVDRASDILAVLAVAKEFNLRPVIAGGAEAWKVASALADAKAPVIVFPLLAGPDSFDMLGTRYDNAAVLSRSGVKVILSTGDTHNARKLRQVAGNAVRAGLPYAAAITAITSSPAEAFGMSAHYGTIAAGKVANLVVWSGDPLEIATRVLAVFVRGRQIPLTNRQTALFEKYRRPAGKGPGARAPARP